MLSHALIALNVALASGWATCDFPKVDWIVVDQANGKSATQKVAGQGTNAWIAGYANENTTLTSSDGGADPLNTESTRDTSNMDMFLAKIDDSGAPKAMFVFAGSKLGSTPGWAEIHEMESGDLAVGISVGAGGSITTPANAGDTLSSTTIANEAAAGSLATFMKVSPGNDDTIDIKWKLTFSSDGGANALSADGDKAGNMYIAYRTCVPCTGDACVPVTDRMGQPTGDYEPICKDFVSMRATVDGAEGWTVEMPAGLTIDTLRTKRTGSGAAVDLYGWGALTGADQTLDGVDYTSAGNGEKSSAILIKFKASDGSVAFAKVVSDESATPGSISPGKMDLSIATNSPVLAVMGTIGSGTKTIGGTELVADFGSYTSFIASLSTVDGSVTWVEQTPMARGVQVSPDNTNIGVFAQTQSGTDVVTLTDTGGETTQLRSRGSWDLIAIRLDADTGAGIYAIDGGGDSMEYFHGFGMNSEGDMLISGYSRSKSFHFGDQTLASESTDGLNKIFTIQVNKDKETPSCVASCNNNEPVVKDNTCLIDNYCYDEGDFSPYSANKCYQCVSATSQKEWTGPNIDAHCFIDDVCYAPNDMKPGVGRSPASTCQTCDPTKSTSAWSIKPDYDLQDGSCVKMPTITTTETAAFTAAMAASTKVTEVIGDAGLKTSFAAAKTLYQGSVLETLAKKSWAGTPDFDLFAAHFGSATWLDDYVLSAADATGQFAGELSPTTRGDMEDARTEAFKKAMQDQILMMACISSVATDKMSDGNWDLAYAYWHGDTNSGAPWARANKRCKNYGTCSSDGETAKANFAVMLAIAAGKKAVADHAAAGDDAEAATAATSAADAAYKSLRAAAYGVYYQAALRYSFKMDSAMGLSPVGATADYQGEGGAFWRVIAPIMMAMDTDVATYVNDFYTMTNAPTTTNSRFCPTLYLLSNNMLSGFTSDDFGTLEDTEAVTCMAGIQLPADASATLTTAMAASSKVDEVIGANGLQTDFAAAKALYQGSVLQTLAKKSDWTDGSYSTQFSTYFGSATWLDDYMLTALDATGQFAGELVPDTRGDMEDARTEAVKKGVQDQILVNAAINTLLASSSTSADWLLFYAYWAGESPNAAPWARANKRCKNYGTCGGGTSGLNGEKAIVNSKLLMIMLGAMTDPAAASAAEAISLCQLVYYQAALRYSFKMDTAIAADGGTADYQGEGGAFWRVIAPLTLSSDGPTNAFVNSFYTMTTVPSGTNHYCPLKIMLHANLPGALTAADMGTLEGTEDVVCESFVAGGNAQVTTILIIAPGSVDDYDADVIAGAAASSLGVSPAQVTVTIGAARRHRHLQGGVTIEISVITQSSTEAASMETAMTTTFGSAATASTFLSAATGTSITVTDEPSAPSSVAHSDGGLSAGALAGIIIGALVGVLAIGGGLYFMMKGKKQGDAKTGHA